MLWNKARTNASLAHLRIPIFIWFILHPRLDRFLVAHRLDLTPRLQNIRHIPRPLKPCVSLNFSVHAIAANIVECVNGVSSVVDVNHYIILCLCFCSAHSPFELSVFAQVREVREPDCVHIEIEPSIHCPHEGPLRCLFVLVFQVLPEKLVHWVTFGFHFWDNPPVLAVLHLFRGYLGSSTHLPRFFAFAFAPPFHPNVVGAPAHRTHELKLGIDFVVDGRFDVLPSLVIGLEGVVLFGARRVDKARGYVLSGWLII